MWKVRMNKVLSEKHIDIFDVLLSFFILLIIFSLTLGNIYTITKKIKDNPDSLVEHIRAFCDDSEKKCNDDFCIRTTMLELNGKFNKAIGKRLLYGQVLLDNGYLIIPFGYTDAKSQADSVIQMKEFCEEKSVNFFYVNAPAKPEKDEDLSRIGLKYYANSNADRLLKRLREGAVSTLDLRENIKQDKLDFYSLFYKTDHHWTVAAGLYAAGVIAKKLNKDCGYKIDEKLYESNNYNYDVRKQCWLGESGRRVSKSYAGLDDFAVITPKFETDLELIRFGGSVDEKGDFSILLNKTCYETPQNLYEVSWHYSYLFGAEPLQVIKNQKEKEGKILLIKDSFAQVVSPFLALGVSELHIWDVRENTNSIREYIQKQQIDTVIIMYTEGMIGNSLDGNSFRMYNF